MGTAYLLPWNFANHLSVFRAACLGRPEDTVAVMAEEKRDRYGIARLPVAELLSLGITVQPAPVVGTPGHAVLPELTAVSYKAEKARWKPIIARLTEIAAADILRRPSPPNP